MSNTNPETLINELEAAQAQLEPLLATTANILQELMVEHGYVMRPNGNTAYLVHPEWADNFDKGWYSKTKSIWHPKLGSVPDKAVVLLYT
jgi:hypothetical protein